LAKNKNGERDKGRGGGKKGERQIIIF